MRGQHGGEDGRQNHPPGNGTRSRLTADASVNGPLRRLGLEGERPEGLLVLRQVLAEDVLQRFGLLRAQIHAQSVVHIHLLRRFLMHEAEDEQKSQTLTRTWTLLE